MTDNEQAIISQKVKAYVEAKDACTEAYANMDWSDYASLDTYRGLSTKALRMNPEHYQLWNIHKRVVAKMCELADADAAHQLLQGELLLTRLALYGPGRSNPKVYSVWYYRRWVLATQAERLDPASETQLWQTELDQCWTDRALKNDPRNFHLWNHVLEVRRRLGQVDPEAAGAWAERVLEAGQSDASWFHQRALIVEPELEACRTAEDGAGRAAVVERELFAVAGAISDESRSTGPWVYLVFVCRFIDALTSDIQELLEWIVTEGCGLDGDGPAGDIKGRIIRLRYASRALGSLGSGADDLLTLVHDALDKLQ